MQPRRSQTSLYHGGDPRLREMSRQLLSAVIGTPPQRPNFLTGRSFVELVVLDVLLYERESLSVFTVVQDGDGRAAFDLSGLAFLVILAVAEPLSEFVSGLHSDQRDLVGFSKSLNALKTCKQLTVTSFEYLGSAQFSASTQQTACFRSRALQTSLRPLTRPTLNKPVGIKHAINPRADRVQRVKARFCTIAYHR